MQMCRFHTEYPTSGPSEDGLDEETREMWDEEWESEELALSECIEYGGITRQDFRGTVETVKAEAMFGSMMCMSQCVDCQPLILQHCTCDGIFGHFCKEWRCIPCVLLEEATLVTRQQKFTRRCEYLGHGKYRYIGVSNAMPFSPEHY